MGRITLCIALCIGSIWGCTERPRGTETTHFPAQPEEIWAVDAEPAVTIGSVDGPPETQLFRAYTGLVLSNGTIVVANGGTAELRYYDAEGRYLRSAGGAGEGPGEFDSLAPIWRIRDDTIAVWDSGLRRFSLFTADGTFAGSTTFIVPPARSSTGQPVATNSVSLRGVFSDGSIVTLNNSVAARRLDVEALGSDERRRRIDEVVLIIPRGPPARQDSSASGAAPRSVAEHDTLGVFAGTEEFVYEAVVQPGGPPRSSYSSITFGERFLSAVGPEFFAVGTGKPYRVSLYDRSGTMRAEVGRAVSPVPVTDDMIQRFLEAAAADVPADRRALRMASLENVPAAGTLPAYSGLDFDQAGNLWVEEFRVTRDEPRMFSVFAPDGRWLAHFEVPDELNFIDMGPDYLLTRARDDLDVEYIRLYRISRSAR